MLDREFPQTEPEDRSRQSSRILFAFLVLLPAVLFGGLQLIASPDLEIWLTERTRGTSRPDAFEHVNRIAPLFSSALGCASILACSLVLLKRTRFLLPLASGPLMAVTIYLASFGLIDPAWFSLLAILTVFLMVSSSVTLVYAVVSRNGTARHKNSSES